MDEYGTNKMEMNVKQGKELFNDRDAWNEFCNVRGFLYIAEDNQE